MQTVKGAQRRIVQLRIGNSQYYEEAIFLVRRDLPRPCFSEREMLAEANRILFESAGVSKPEKPAVAKTLAWFFGGMVFGFVLACGLLFLRFGS